jgi:phage-related protein
MAKPPSPPTEKPVHWMGSSKNDLKALPEEVVRHIGYALGVAQLGGKHPSAKAWKGEGPGVFEVVESFDGDAYRAIYTVKFEKAIYALHVFQKKSPSGIRTAQTDIDKVSARLKAAHAHYEKTYPRAPKGKEGKHGE